MPSEISILEGLSHPPVGQALEIYKETQKKMSEDMQEMLDEKVNLLPVACLYLCGEKTRR